MKDRGYRQVWRFEYQERGYFLKFYPRRGVFLRLRRLIVGAAAWREFDRLRSLQKAGIPSPRAIAHLSGFRLDGEIGDAVILEAIEPSVTLDQYLNDLQLRGEPIPDHLMLAQQIRTLVYQLSRAGLGHRDLHLGNFLLHERKLYLLDGYAVHKGGLRMNDILQLGHGVGEFATKTDLQRGWELLGDGRKMPNQNRVSRTWWNRLVRRSTGENRYFGNLRVGEWSGHYFKQHKYPRRWSAASRWQVSEKDWQEAWPVLLGQIESDQLEVLKRSASGDVLGGEVILGEKPLAVVVKRPRRKRWYRYFNELFFRGTRSRRAWKRAWSLIARNIPTAWPLILMETRVLGYATDQIIVFERVPGPMLSQINLDELSDGAREDLMRRTGRLLRQLDRTGLCQYDSKASNWIIKMDEMLGPVPMLIDVDGIRTRTFGLWSMPRLLTSMRDHPQYTPADSLNLCRGYAPFAPLQQEEVEPGEGEAPAEPEP